MAGITTLDGGNDNNDVALTTAGTFTNVADVTSTGLVLIDNELILVTAIANSGHDLSGCTRGAMGSVAASHLTGADVYEVKHVAYNSNGILIYYIDTTAGLSEHFSENTAFEPNLPIPVIGVAPDNSFLRVASSIAEWDTATTDFAAPASLTDSTTGSPAATLVEVRSDTAAHTAADANANFASLNAKLEALYTAIAAAKVVGE